MSDICGVCITNYKGSRIVKVTCQYCPFHACKGCQQNYLLQTYEDPHCMECKQLWSSDFLATSFPLLFRNGPLRKHRRQVLYEREKALLPSMQVFAQAKREINHLETQLKTMNEGENLASLRSAIATIKKMGREAMDEWVRLKLARESLEEKRGADPLSVTEE